MSSYRTRTIFCRTKTLRTKTLQEVYVMNENEKKDDYLESVLNVEKPTFTPAAFLTFGGMSKECKQFVNRLVDLIARKRKESYCDVVRHVRTMIRFAMLRITLITLRGHRGKKIKIKHETPLSEDSYNLIPAPMME